MGEGFDLEAMLRPIRAARSDPTGEVLSGCKLERVLGRGAMGEAWLARRQDGASVVVKLLDPLELSQPEKRARARREWETLRRVRPTPHVVSILGVDLDHARPHLVMEYVAGQALDDLVAKRGGLPWDQAARIARDLALGLATVHEQGVVHRDVKPANAILRPDGRATLLDFGLAKDLHMTNLTVAGTLLGTAAYMAPEQWGEGAKDGRCDLFALGASLYHLAAGRPPFAGTEVQEIADAATAGEYEPLEEAAPGAPLELALAVDLMLAPDPAQRYQRAEEVAADLEAVLAGRPCSAPCLLDAAGRRWPLARGRRFTLGSAQDCQVVLPAPASPRHAQVRREAAGFVLVDVRGSAGTRAGGAVVRDAPHPLRDGDALELGGPPGVALVFREPLRPGASRGTARVAAAGAPVDVRRTGVPAPVAQALAEAGDARATAWLLERLAPDPTGPTALARALAPLLGPDAARAAAGARQTEDARGAPWARERLVAIAGGDPGDAGAWLAWWIRGRGGAPEQVAPPEPPRATRLLVEGGTAGGAQVGQPPGLDLAGRGVVLVGRDARCDVVVGAQSPRLAATLVRLHARWVARDEVTLLAGALDPGAAITLGGARLLVAADDPTGPVIDPAAFWALASAGHPATRGGLAAVLALGPSVEAALRALGHEADAVGQRARALMADAARAARERLAAACGRDLGPDPAAWSQALAASPAGGSPSIAGAGWVP